MPPLAIGIGHERALTPLFVLLLVGTVGGALASVLVLFCLAFEDTLTKGLRSQKAEAQASVLAAVVAFATTWVVATAGPPPCLTVGTPMGVQDIACVAVEAETFMHRNRAAWSAALLCPVDLHVLVKLF